MVIKLTEHHLKGMVLKIKILPIDMGIVFWNSMPSNVNKCYALKREKEHTQKRKIFYAQIAIALNKIKYISLQQYLVVVSIQICAVSF